MGEQRKWFLEPQFTSGGDAMKIAGMTTKNLDQYMNLVDQAATELERMDSNPERSSTAGKMLPNNIT